MFFKQQKPLKDNKHYIFIGGLHRSGTSLLHRMLTDASDVTGFSDTGVPEDEGQHLQTVYPAAKHFGGPGKFCFDTNAYMDEKHILINEANRKQLIDDWEQHWDDSPIRIEKSPPNIIRSRFLQAMFPQSHIVFIIRHPIAVSIATQKWSHTSGRELMLHWHMAHRCLLRDKKYLKQCTLLRYEDLVSNPDKVIKNLCEKLNIPVSANRYEIKQDINQRYYSMWDDIVIKERINIDKIQRYHCAHQFGYTLAPPYVSEGAIESLAK